MYKKIILLTVLFLFSCSKSRHDNMVFIEGGTFQMGDIWGDSQRQDDKPAHSVTVDDFYISKYEVTFEEFLEFLNDQHGISEDGKLNGIQIVNLDSLYCPVPIASTIKLENSSFHFHPAFFADDMKCPATSMTWFGAIEYCNWKSKKEGFDPCYTITSDNVISNWEADGYRLPTEAEWEYAAGGGSSTKQKYAGTDSTNLKDYMWFYKNSGDSLLGVDFWKKYNGVDIFIAVKDNNCRTHRVGTKKPNQFGIYDMNGNVNEWCWDIYDSNYYTQKDSINPKGPETGKPFRSLRGGVYRYHEFLCRTTSRSGRWQKAGHYEAGFRVCRSAK